MNMNPETELERLERVFRSVFGPDYESGSRPTREDLPVWDSLGHVRLVLEIEAEYGIRIDDQDLVTLHRDFDTVLGWLRRRCDPAAAEARS
ncbi:MAG TPA: acyl carrier protein [Spirochaetia bacterium]|nr:acyl carrier protein [Spirochaetia bacterium]